MENYTLSSRQIPLCGEYDVIVVGGGPAGCAAAISASRAGKKVLLIEDSGMLGGAGTRGLVSAWTPFSDGVRALYAGLAHEVFRRTLAATPYLDPKSIDWVPIDPEALKTTYDEMTAEAGVTVLFHTRLAAAETEDGRVKALICANKTGLCAFTAPMYVDCTGDADLCAYAGVPFQEGDENGETQPATHCFILANVNEEAYHAMPSIRPQNPESILYRILREGKYAIPDEHFCHSFYAPGVMGFNAGHLWHVKATDPASVSKADADGRRLAHEYLAALKDYMPETFGQAVLVETAPMVGIRESRRIRGEYSFTLADYLARRSFPDEICRGNYFVDVHYSAEENNRREGKSPSNGSDLRYEHYGKGESYGIPYRCLIPVGLKNVLDAGRSLSCERAALGSLRVMPACLCMGQAAGLAAAMACELGDVRLVDTDKLRASLREAGAYLP